MTNPQDLLAHIGAGLADDADDLTRQRGVNACRMVLAVLGANAGEPLQLGGVATAPAASPAPAAPTSRIASAAKALATVPPGAILDAVIAKLRASLPPEQIDTEPDPEPIVLHIPFIPVPKLKGGQ